MTQPTFNDDTPIEKLVSEYIRLQKLHEKSNEKKISDEEYIEKTDRFMISCNKGELSAHPIWRVYNADMKLVDLYMAPKKLNRSIKFPINCNRKQYLLEKCVINYESFYNYIKTTENDEYKKLINEESIIEFLINQFSYST